MKLTLPFSVSRYATSWSKFPNKLRTLIQINDSFLNIFQILKNKCILLLKLLQVVSVHSGTYPFSLFISKILRSKRNVLQSSWHISFSKQIICTRVFLYMNYRAGRVMYIHFKQKFLLHDSYIMILSCKFICSLVESE